MKITRRILLSLAFGSAALLLFAMNTPSRPPKDNSSLIYVGTYTQKTQSKGIYAFKFDADTGKLTPQGLAAESVNPSFVAVHPSGKYLYAVNEAAVTDDGKHGGVSAFAIDPQTGKLTFLNEVSSLGVDPCFISFDKTGKFALVANYSSGDVAVFPVLEDGKVGKAAAFLKDEGKLGPNTKRQEGPHAHFIETSANNHFAYVSDLGLDRILIYKFDQTKGTLERADSNASDSFSAVLAPGTGPRHLVFSGNGDFMYVLGEMGSTVTVIANVSRERYRAVQSISTLPPKFSGRNDAAEIVLHPSGKFLYTSNRGEDTIAIFSVDQKTGKLTHIRNVPTGGKEPRHFTLDPSGKFLLAENQLSDSIKVFRVDPATGNLSPLPETASVPSPICLVFLNQK